jgi:hypothetical protein
VQGRSCGSINDARGVCSVEIEDRMRARVAYGLALAAAAAALLLSQAPPATATTAVAPCPNVAVAFLNASQAAYVYGVTVSGGPAECGEARSVVRQVLTRPAFVESATFRVSGWVCSLWRDSEPWTISCAHGGVVARAYGPTIDTDSWHIAAAALSLPVLEPLATARYGLRLVNVSPKSTCSNTVPQQQVTASYTGIDGATLSIVEQKPQCGNLGVAVLLARWRIHGSPAVLLEACPAVGCSRTSGDYILHWQERGDDIVMQGHAVSQTELLALARSMTLVTP